MKILHLACLNNDPEIQPNMDPKCNTVGGEPPISPRHLASLPRLFVVTEKDGEGLTGCLVSATQDGGVGLRWSCSSRRTSKNRSPIDKWPYPPAGSYIGGVAVVRYPLAGSWVELLGVTRRIQFTWQRVKSCHYRLMFEKNLKFQNLWYKAEQIPVIQGGGLSAGL